MVAEDGQISGIVPFLLEAACPLGDSDTGVALEADARSVEVDDGFYIEILRFGGLLVDHEGKHTLGSR